jgi:hypothetical protein
MIWIGGHLARASLTAAHNVTMRPDGSVSLVKPLPHAIGGTPSRNFMKTLCFRRSGQISGRDATCPHPTDAQCETATCSHRHVRVWPLFVGVSLAGGGVSVGHNRTRPPPCMRWRGPCSTCRSRLAGLPGSAGSGGPTAGASHPLLVPVSRFLPRPRSFPWGGARFRRESISTPQSSRGASVRGEQLRFFSLSTE